MKEPVLLVEGHSLLSTSSARAYFIQHDPLLPHTPFVYYFMVASMAVMGKCMEIHFHQLATHI